LVVVGLGSEVGEEAGEGGGGAAFDEPEVVGVSAAVFGFVDGLARDVEGAVGVGEVLQHGAQVVQRGGDVGAVDVRLGLGQPLNKRIPNGISLS
jgi:hypothetical protein